MRRRTPDPSLTINLYALLQVRPDLVEEVEQTAATFRHFGRFCWVEDQLVGRLMWPEGHEESARERYKTWLSHGVPASLMKLSAAECRKAVA
jgi:hypothetical protein